MYLIWINCSYWDDFFDFGDANLSCSCCILIEVSSRFSKLKISVFISSPCTNKCIITGNCWFKQIVSSIEIFDFSWLTFNCYVFTIRFVFDWESTVFEDCPNTRCCIIPWNPSTTSSKFFCKSSLWDKFQF